MQTRRPIRNPHLEEVIAAEALRVGNMKLSIPEQDLGRANDFDGHGVD